MLHMMETDDIWEIVHLPPKVPFPVDSQPTVDVFASAIKPNLAHAIVRRLNQIAPLENLRHVKRVRKEQLEGGKFQLHVILCLAPDGENPLCISKDVLDLISSHQLSAFITKVCKFPASSKEEWEEQCKLWPTSYHPPTYNIDGITGFNEEDTQSVCRFMSSTIRLAKSGCSQVVNAALIVDPSVKHVIASGCDETFSWCSHTERQKLCDSYHEPQLHPIDSNIAASQTAPDSLGLSDGSKELYSGVSCLHPWKWTQREKHPKNSLWNPLRHASMAAINYSAARDRHLFPGMTHHMDKFTESEQVQSSLGDSQVKRQKITMNGDVATHEDDNNDRTSKFDRPYLCTGYDIYLVWEPCIMCAMALVHQRIRRIFFAFQNPHAGALGTVHRLQGEESLNHHYAVFRVMVPEENLAI